MPNLHSKGRGRKVAKVHLTPEERAARWAAHKDAIAVRKASAAKVTRVTPESWAARSAAMTARKLERAGRLPTR